MTDMFKVKSGHVHTLYMYTLKAYIFTSFTQWSATFE